MSQRITKAMLQSAVDAYVRTLEAHELLRGPLDFRTGNTSYSYAWTLRYESDGTSPTGISSGVLGYTAREAYNKLHTIIDTLHDVKERNESL